MMSAMTLKHRQARHRGRLLCLFSTVAFATSAAAGTYVGTTRSEQAPHRQSDDGRRTLRRLPANLGRGALGVFSREDLAPLVIGGVATGGASFFDDNVRNAAADPESGFGKGFETAGGSGAVVFVAGMFVGGRFAHGSRFRAMTYDFLDGAIVNGAYTQLLKVATRRERPDGSNKQSLPSGHTSDAFTLATIAERHYGWAVGAPAYALAAAVGYSRIVRDKHFLSDVVAGATLGYIVGRTTARVNSEVLPPGKVAWSLSPVLARRTAGIEIDVRF